VHGEPQKMAVLASMLEKQYGIKATMPDWQESVTL
jgi:hypothetical protein